MSREIPLLWFALGLGLGLAGLDSLRPLATAAQEVARQVPARPEEGGPRVWEVTGVTKGLNLREDPTSSGRILRRHPAGTVLQNLGCQQRADRIWCLVQELRGGPVGYVAQEFLKPAVGPDGAIPMGQDQSAYRAGQGDFDATGRIPCAQHPGQPMTECEFAVARDSGGYATVLVTKPDGVKRAIYFALGVAVGADTSQADGYPEFTVEKESDLNFVKIGDERYEIPDAVVLGG